MSEKKTSKYKLRIPDIKDVVGLVGVIFDCESDNVEGVMFSLAIMFLSCFPEQPTAEEINEIYQHVIVACVKKYNEENA